MRALFSSLLVTLLTLLASTVVAQDAEKRFSDAVDLFIAKQCDQALPIFREVHAETKSPNARLYIARCLDQSGDVVGAYEQMRATVVDASALAEDQPKYAETRDAAASELSVFELKVGMVVVAVADPPSDTVARIGKRELALGQPTAVAPGDLVVIVSAPGFEPVQRSASVKAGATTTIALTLTDKPSDEEAVPDDTGGFGAVRGAGIAVAGLGAVGVVVFAILGAQAKSEFDELNAKCAGTTCPDEDAERISDGRTLTTVANVSLVIGAVALLAGTTMIIFGGPGEDDPTNDDDVAIRIGPGHIEVSGRF